jgi:streptomycin 6-kinase
VHAPAVIAPDERLGALLLEAVEPGTPLEVSSVYPAADSVAGLLSSLHGSGVPAIGQRVAYLFGSSAKLYERHPELTALVPPELYQRGHALATRLAQHDSPIVLLHGDLTPASILDGGAERGLVVTGVDAGRLFSWCTAFAAMSAMELASQPNRPSGRFETLLELASHAQS